MPIYNRATTSHKCPKLSRQIHCDSFNEHDQTTTLIPNQRPRAAPIRYPLFLHLQGSHRPPNGISRASHYQGYSIRHSLPRRPDFVDPSSCGSILPSARHQSRPVLAPQRSGLAHRLFLISVGGEAIPSPSPSHVKHFFERAESLNSSFFGSLFRVEMQDLDSRQYRTIGCSFHRAGQVPGRVVQEPRSSG